MKRIFVLLALVLLLGLVLGVAASCGSSSSSGKSSHSTDDDSSPADDDDDVSPADDDDDASPADDDASPGSVILSKQVVIIPDSQAAQATVTATSITFPLAGNGNLLDLQLGNVLVSGYKNGFLRKVADVQQTGNQIVIDTRQATLEDVFEYANLKLVIPLAGAKKDTWLYVDLSGNEIFDGNIDGVPVDIETGAGSEFSFTPTITFAIDISWYQLISMTLTVDAAFTAGIDLSVTLGGEIASGNEEMDIPIPFEIPPLVIMAGPVPIVIVPDVSLTVTASFGADAEIELDGGFSASANLTMGFSYQNSAISPIAQANFEYGPLGPTFQDQATATVGENVSLSLAFNLYDVAGPYINIGPAGQISATASLAPPSCSYAVTAGVQAVAGAKVSVLGEDLANFETTVWDTSVSLASGSCADDDDDATDDDDDNDDDNDNDNADDDDATPPLGACCQGMSCAVTSGANCQGSWMGQGTICVPNPCADDDDDDDDDTTPQLGACCNGTSCSVLSDKSCTGSWMGQGTICVPNPCADDDDNDDDDTTPPLGACCNGTSCSVLAAGNCAGSWKGQDTICVPNPCADDDDNDDDDTTPPLGACCNGTSCSVLAAENCAGSWKGASTTCSPNPCTDDDDDDSTPPLGACCVGNSCSVTSGAGCGGTWEGQGTTCSPNPCVDDDDDSSGVWTDTTTGYMWQASSSTDNMLDQASAESYCANLSLGGYSGWTLPDINALRTLIRGCAATETGGSCNVTDECSDSSCDNTACNGCANGGGPASGCYWPSQLSGDCIDSWYWSSTSVGDESGDAWAYDPGSASVGSGPASSSEYVRCVRK